MKLLFLFSLILLLFIHQCNGYIQIYRPHVSRNLNYIKLSSLLNNDNINDVVSEVPTNTIVFQEGDILESSQVKSVSIRDEDLEQERDLDLILTERASRFYVNNGGNTVEREKCILVAVDQTRRQGVSESSFNTKESLSELSELVGTGGLQVCGLVIQRMNTPNVKTYIGPGKVAEIMAMVNQTRYIYFYFILFFSFFQKILLFILIFCSLLYNIHKY